MDLLPPKDHNNPPNDAELLVEILTESTSEIRARHDQLIGALQRLPPKIEDDETAGKVGDFIKQIAACAKSFDTLREGKKEPYLTLGRTVDGFFKPYMERLQNAKTEALKPVTAYLQAKEAEERHIKILEAERLRKEALEKMAEANAKAEQARLAEIANMPSSAEVAIQSAIRLEYVANTAIKSANAAIKASEGNAASFARTRGTLGALATLRTSKQGTIEDIAILDLESLRYHISQDALQKAVNSFVRAGGTTLKGARIEDVKTGMVK